MAVRIPRYTIAVLVSCCFLFASHFVHSGNIPMQDCAALDCSEGIGDLVCGSNGKTYDSKCHIEVDRCLGLDVSYSYDGQCSESESQCWAERSAALKQSKALSIALSIRKNIFIPECLEDGSFAEIQCQWNTAHCWCVDKIRGGIIAGTTVQHRRPTCLTATEDEASLERSNEEDSGSSESRQCSSSDRFAFNENLMSIFREEHQRRVVNNTDMVTDDAKVIRWRFEQLDLDQNGTLSPDEFRGLTKLIRKIIKPRWCAVSFRLFCDGDLDRQISWKEWSSCVLSTAKALQMTPSAKASGSRDRTIQSKGSSGGGEKRKKKKEQNVGRKGSGGRLSLPLKGEPLGLDETELAIMLSDSSSSPRKKRKGKRRPSGNKGGCWLDRERAMERKRLGDSSRSIPECDEENRERYQRIQCFHSEGYCWCVDQKSGRPIPGTSVKDQTPRCDEAPKTYRVMKGCSSFEKKIFLRQLFEILADAMRLVQKKSDLVGGNNQTASSATPEEELARWKFRILDTDDNGVLDKKKEWKLFRRWSKGFKELKRRCAKRLPKHCDYNLDKLIDLKEWLRCLDVSNVSVEIRSRPRGSPPSGRGRRGKNPLTSILNPDH